MGRGKSFVCVFCVVGIVSIICVALCVRGGAKMLIVVRMSACWGCGEKTVAPFSGDLSTTEERP
jgi:hypothetical protein